MSGERSDFLGGKVAVTALFFGGFWWIFSWFLGLVSGFEVAITWSGFGLKGRCVVAAPRREVWTETVFWWCVDWLGKADRCRRKTAG